MSGTFDPGLYWAIKTSFFDYVAKLPDGRAAVGAGAKPAGGSIVRFEPVVTGEPPQGTDVVLAFRGEVRFSGHGGMLEIRIIDPTIVARAGVAEMTVVDPREPATETRVPFVRFTLVADAGSVPLRGWFSSDVRLTQEGSDLFSNVYPPEEPFEPLLVRAS